MPITSMPTVAPGDTITAAGWNIITGNINLLDGRTGGDPGTAGKIIGSTGALGSTWTTILAMLGYTPANVAGDTFSGNVILNNAVFIQGKTAAGVLRTLIVLPSDNKVYVGDGSHVLNLQCSSLQLNAAPFSSSFSVVGHTHAVGDATTLDGLDSLYFLARVNHTGTQLAATISDLATAVSGMAAASAASVPAGSITDVNVAAANKDGTVGTACMRTIGGGAQQAAGGNHGHSSGVTFADNAGLLDSLDSSQFIRKDTDQTLSGGSPRVWTLSAGGLRLNGNVQIDGNFVQGPTGSKSRQARGFDDQLGIFHALETPVPMFSELGRAQLWDGMARIEIPPDYANYVDLTDYHVHLTPEGPSHLYVDAMTPSSFTVRSMAGSRDSAFSWVLLARQGDSLHVERTLPMAQRTP